MSRFLPLATLLSLSAALAACGGGDDSSASTTGAGGGTLTLSAATPASNNTTLNLASAGTRGNNTRAADGFSTQAYCEVFFENVPGANGATYAVQVYFRQSDKAALHTSVVGSAGSAAGWVVFDNASGSPITNVAVDTAARTVTFNNKALADGAGNVATLSGAASFPANAGTAACGS